MRLVMTVLVPEGAADGLGTQLRFHLAAGVDAIVVSGRGLGDVTRGLPTAVADRVQVVEEDGGTTEPEARARLARQAASELEADWILDSAPGEFWWPRAGGLKDVLIGIPSRYTVVQALVRRFGPGENGELGTERTSLSSYPPEELAPGTWLRPVYRADSRLVLVEPGAAAEAWRVPLRAWYPIELFDHASTAADVPRTVQDTRLADALGRLEESGELALPVPDLVDDAAYAVECAMLGEADFEAVESSLEDLERRIAALEARFWPTARRFVRRLARRG
jgi:hypothetical protein